MKRNLLLFLLNIFFSWTCFAQLQNGDFESWTTTTFKNPTGYSTSNGEAFRAGIAPNTTQYTPAHGGNYSIKLETKITATDTIFSYFSNGIDDPMQGKGGVPYSMTPDSLYMYAKLGIIPNDTGLVLVFFKKSGSIISTNLLKITGNNPSVWQKLSFKLNTLPMAPDSVIIAAASSNAFSQQGIQNGSSLIIDDISFNTSAPIPYGDFESWTTTSFDDPDFWYSENVFLILNNQESALVKTADAYKGTYAAKLTTSVFNGQNWYIFSLGNYNHDKQEGGFPYTTQKDTLIGWYKYIPQSGDTAAVNLSFIKDGQYFFGTSTFFNAASEYTKFEIPFDLMQAPDSAVIEFNSSKYPASAASLGSTLYIDEVQFKSAPLYTSIHSYSKDKEVTIFPTPNNGQFSICYIPQENSTYKIINLIGETVSEGKIYGSKTSVNIQDSPKGIYIVQIRDGNKILNKKITIQ